MALSANQQQQILRFLGWAGLTVVPDSTHFNSVVNDRLGNNVAKPLTAAIEKQVKNLIEKIENIEECLAEAKCRLAASSIDGIKTNPNEIRELNKERRRCIRELSDLLDIPIMKTGAGCIPVVS